MALRKFAAILGYSTRTDSVGIGPHLLEADATMDDKAAIGSFMEHSEQYWLEL